MVSSVVHGTKHVKRISQNLSGNLENGDIVSPFHGLPAAFLLAVKSGRCNKGWPGRAEATAGAMFVKRLTNKGQQGPISGPISPGGLG